MMRTILTAICLVCLTSMAHAALSVTVPGDYATINAAVAAVDAGGTITITDSATYVERGMTIDKSLKIFAAAGQSPLIQNDATSTSAVVPFTFTQTSGDVQIGSNSGGRIRLQYNRLASGNATQFMLFRHTTDTLVTIENVDVLCTGVTTVQSPHFTQADRNYANRVIIRNVDVNQNFATVTSASYGVVIGTTAAVYSNPTRSPVYLLDRVRIKGYNRSGVWNQFRGAELNIVDSEVGVLGQKNTAGNYPWGGFINNQAACPFVGRFTTSVFRGAAAGHAVWIGSCGSSVTLSRCVAIQQYTISATAPNGALYLGANSGTAVVDTPRMTVTADHCDFVDLSPVNNFSAAIATRIATGDARTTYVLTVSNSNIYSAANKAFNATLKTGVNPDEIHSDHNNVYGQGTSAGYTAGTGDIAFDPMYTNASASDVRYSNNTLKTADSAGAPVGTNASYADVYISGIVPGEAGVINRAHGWTTLK